MKRNGILAVDDDPNIPGSLQSIPEQEGFAVETAADGGAARARGQPL